MSKTKASHYLMYEEFEIKGYWNLPDSEIDVPGILLYSKEKITLELLGNFYNETIELLNRELELLDIILGTSTKGEKITLLNSFSIKRSLNMPGYATENYNVSSILVGEHYQSMESITFYSATFHPTYLTKWIGRQPFEERYKRDIDTNSLIQADLSYTPPQTFNIYIESIDSELTDEYIANFSGNNFEYSNWKFKSKLRLKPSTLQNLDWYLDNINKIKDLTNLFIGLPVFLESIIFYSELIEGQEHRTEVYYFRPQKNYKHDVKKESLDFIFNFNEIELSFNQIVNSWFQKKDLLKVVNTLYFSEFYKDTYLESGLINAIQTLEIYHRRRYAGKYIDPIVYSADSQKALDIIESNLPKEIYERLAGGIKYGNEYTLSKRLRELFNDLTDETKKFIFENSDKRNKFIQRIVDTRNYLTHYDHEGKTNILSENEEMYYSMQRLRIIASIILFKELTIQEPLILERVRSNRHVNFNISKAKELLQ